MSAFPFPALGYGVCTFHLPDDKLLGLRKSLSTVPHTCKYFLNRQKNEKSSPRQKTNNTCRGAPGEQTQQHSLIAPPPPRGALLPCIRTPSSALPGHLSTWHLSCCSAQCQGSRLQKPFSGVYLTILIHFSIFIP